MVQAHLVQDGGVVIPWNSFAREHLFELLLLLRRTDSLVANVVDQFLDILELGVDVLPLKRCWQKPRSPQSWPEPAGIAAGSQ